MSRTPAAAGSVPATSAPLTRSLVAASASLLVAGCGGTTTTTITDDPPTTATHTTAPAPSGAATTAGRHACDQNISAGRTTTCGFADNVFRAYAAAIQSGRSGSTVRASSPATGQAYTLSCADASGSITCTGGDGAAVFFPRRAAAIY